MEKAKYTLRSKDLPLINFSLQEKEEKGYGITRSLYGLTIDKVFNENQALFPKKLEQNLNEDALLKWIVRRKAPKNRRFVEKILATFDDSHNPMRYVDISHALSLNDAYWITQNDEKLKWENVNLYAHPFDDILAYVAFTGYSQKVSGLVTSPEFTTNGALKKCWSNRPDGIYLLKGDDFALRADGRSQATMEYYASQVAEAMGFDPVPYDLEEFKHKDGTKEIICKCKLFTSEDEGFVEAATFYADRGVDIINTDCHSLAVQKNLGRLFGENKYADIMLFDSLIANQDRHFGNFGMIVDNNTGKYLRPAPIFDNGVSFFYGAAGIDLSSKEHIEGYIKSLGCRYFSLDEQAQIFVQKRHLPQLKKLFNFEFTRHPKYNVEDRTLKLMSQFVRDRARQTVKLYAKKMNMDR